MRIDAYNAVNQIYQTSQISKAKATAKTSSASDKFEADTATLTYQPEQAVSAASMFGKIRLPISRHAWQQEHIISVQKLLQIRF